MSVFLTPELKPFLGGTYFAPHDGPAGLGFPSVLRLIAKKWTEQADEIRSSSNRMHESFCRALSSSSGPDVAAKDASEWIATALHYFTRKFDAELGGFGGPPKFPTPVNLLFLLDLVRLCRAQTMIKEPQSARLSALGLGLDAGEEEIQAVEAKVWTMVQKTLLGIWRGGIHDHVGGGVHRYAVDRRWHLPQYNFPLS